MKASVVWQGLLAAAVLLLGYAAVHQATANLAARSIPVGFGFLARPASFEIGMSLLPLSPDASYARVIAAGLVNTLLVSLLGIAGATILGVAAGIARLSPNLALRLLCSGYVETVRNTPLLLQLLIWYGGVFTAAPLPQQAWRLLPGVYLCNRGLALPWPAWDGGGWHVAAPLLGRFNFEGGLTVPPEMLALLVGLVIYTAAYIAEIVRGGILSVERGQLEAAEALGLSRRQALRYVVWPQALRVILPPLIGQFLNLIKNSSLALAIGFPDLVAVTNTVINQTGQAIEGITVILVVYLVLSLAVSSAMGRVNRHFALLGVSS
jgi:general L-amino acid transport system permease protein